MKKKYLLAICGIVVAASLTGCAAISDWISTTKGSLIGQHFQISTYDNYGSRTNSTEGSRINVGLLENNANNETESTGFKSEVLDVTIDEHQMLSVGNTLIFVEDGVQMVSDFNPEDFSAIHSRDAVGFIPFDKFINSVSNNIGKSRVVLVSSQLGTPIGLFQGDNVYISIPSDLPKMTRLNIDGKSVYIHRANYQIIDTALLK